MEILAFYSLEFFKEPLLRCCNKGSLKIHIVGTEQPFSVCMTKSLFWVSSYKWQALSVFWNKYDLHRLPNISYLSMHLPIYAFFKFLPTYLAKRTNFLMCNFLESFLKIGVRFATSHFIGAKADTSDKFPATQFLTVSYCGLWNSQENLLDQLNDNETQD